MRVLVAEDGLANQHVAIGLLKVAGHQATIASDGKEALTRWREGNFDAILMDVHMPEMDGLEATRLIRAEEEHSDAHIPIIALTAAAMDEDAQACRESGMDDYLTKPIHPRSLQLMLLKYARHRAGSAAPLEAKSDAQADPEPHGEASEAEQETEIVAERKVTPALPVDVIDVEAAVQRIAGGVEGVFGLSQIFKTEAATLIQTMRAAVDSNEAAEVHRAAHTLKGSANLFVAKRMSSIATDIEQCAKVGELSEILPRISQLEEEIHVFFNAVDQLKNGMDTTG
jgi:CheY-like chemotaxis protein